jgi:hypothetical protein
VTVVTMTLVAAIARVTILIMLMIVISFSAPITGLRCCRHPHQPSVPAGGSSHQTDISASRSSVPVLIDVPSCPPVAAVGVARGTTLGRNFRRAMTLSRPEFPVAPTTISRSM